MNKKIPPYLYNKRNNVKMICFVAVFALLFINLFQPFGSRNWYPGISDVKYFVFSSLIILVGMLIVVLSRILMRTYVKAHTITYWKFALWILAEILFMALFYTVFSKFFPKDGIEREISEIFKRSLTNTALILLLPYSISWLYFSWKEKSAMLHNMENTLNTDSYNKSLIAFPNEKGDLKISIMQENLLYIESADNYAKIYYLNKSGISHFLLRNSLKWIEERYTSETSLTRCHRSFIVNIDKVKVLKKLKTGIVIELEVENTPDIPVSKTYYTSFMDKFSKYSV